MRTEQRSLLQATLLVAALGIACATAQAQEALDPLADPTFGSAALDAGFGPDPFEIELIGGGFVDASEAVDASCSGFVGSEPDFRLDWSGAGRDLRIFFVGAGDTTLVVNDPSGAWHCNDDFEDANPLIEFPASPAGQYRIWVGSFAGNENPFGRLFATELPLSPAEFAAEVRSLDVAAAPNFGGVTLGVGFTPDPFGIEVLSGGGVDVFADLDEMGCSGFVTEAPDFSLTWTDDGGSLLRILVVAEGDTTLIVHDPLGDWSCNDDFSGIDPLVEFVNPESGRYAIWIGSFDGATVIPGILYITERAMGPDDF